MALCNVLYLIRMALSLIFPREIKASIGQFIAGHLGL